MPLLVPIAMVGRVTARPCIAPPLIGVRARVAVGHFARRVRPGLALLGWRVPIKALRLDALLALPGIDLVIVCSPDELHADHAIAALRAGKHVLVDKPFAATLADARRVAAEAEGAGRLLAIFS